MTSLQTPLTGEDLIFHRTVATSGHFFDLSYQRHSFEEIEMQYFYGIFGILLL